MLEIGCKDMPLSEFTRKLQNIVGRQHVSLSGAAAEIYSYDASLVKGAPDIIVFPENTREVSQIARLAHEAGIPFLARGFGTNLSGGTIPTSGGLVISLPRLNKILEIRTDGRFAVVQPGVTNLELQNALEPMGFFYAPDPASQKVATLGGNLAENSGGPRCVKYGVTTNHILGMEFVLPDGEILKIGGAALDPPGYDLRGLAVGSEGTFGIATEITVRILPKAEKIISLLVVYDQLSDAAVSVSEIVSAGIVPATLEMMDTLVIQAVEDSYSCGYPRDAAAVLIIEVEGPIAGLEEQAERINQICHTNNCREVREAKDESERNRLWEGRRGAFGAIARLAPNYLVNDCTVPRSKLPQALEHVGEISNRYGFRHGNVFHAGDGNLHPLLFFDARGTDELQKVKEAGWEIMSRCVELGGTISGEHGIGVEKMRAMGLIQTEAEFDIQRRIKNVFDPFNCLNPGKVIPENDGGIKRLQIPTISQPEQEIAEKIKNAAAAEKKVILPKGLGNHLLISGNIDDFPTSIENLTLAEIIDLDSSNQTVIAGGGVTLRTLQDALKTNNQWLAISPPFSHQDYTLGGLVATAACGPERIYYGAPRDLLLGLRFIDAQGRFITTGGRVMKNVAGYDLTRLMAGSRGTLGFITEVILRVSSLPEKSMVILGNGSYESCVKAATRLNESILQPVFTVSTPELEPANDVNEIRWMLHAGFAGFKKTVDYQLSKATALLEECGLTVQNQVDYSPHRGVFADYFINLDKQRYITKFDLPPNVLKEFVPELQKLIHLHDIWVDSGCGRVYAGMDELIPSEWENICALSKKYMGYATIEKAPENFIQKVDVFGPTRPEWALTRKLKAELDPNGVFYSGFFAGIITD